MFSFGKIIKSTSWGSNQELRSGTQESRNMLNQGKNWKSEFGSFEECWKQRVRGPDRPWAPGLRAAPGIAPSAGGFSLAL